MGQSKRLKINNFFRKEFKKNIIKVSFFGSLQFYLFISVLTSLIYYDLNILYSFILGLLILYILVSILRLLFFKKRPKEKTYSNIYEKIKASSFPSMHSARIGLISFIFLNLFYLVSYFLLFIWVLVSISRIYLKKHDIFDIISGLIIAYLVSKLIYLI